MGLYFVSFLIFSERYHKLEYYNKSGFYVIMCDIFSLIFVISVGALICRYIRQFSQKFIVF